MTTRSPVRPDLEKPLPTGEGVQPNRTWKTQILLEKEERRQKVARSKILKAVVINNNTKALLNRFFKTKIILRFFELVLFELSVGGEEHDRDSLEPADLSQEPVFFP